MQIKVQRHLKEKKHLAFSSSIWPLNILYVNKQLITVFITIITAVVTTDIMATDKDCCCDLVGSRASQLLKKVPPCTCEYYHNSDHKKPIYSITDDWIMKICIILEENIVEVLKDKSDQDSFLSHSCINLWFQLT